LWVSTVLVAVIATICIVAYVEFEESHLRNIDRTLSAMANGILASLHEREGEEQMIDRDIRAVTGTSAQNPSTFYRIWMDGASADMFASDPPDSEHGRWLRGLPEQSGPMRESLTFMNIGSRRTEYRAAWMRHKLDEGIVNIVVAGSSHYTYHEMREFLKLLLILGGSLIVGSVVAVMWSVRCSLRPIHMTAERLHRISRPNVGRALFDDLKVPEELHPFVGALRDMLGRLDKVLQQQKQFTSDAAHELRTPLAVVKSTLQATQMHERDANEYRRAIADALKDVARMEHLIEQLLVLARMDENSEHIAAAEVQLDVLLRELAEAYHQRIERSGGKVILEEPPVTTVQGDLDELARLFSNVLDNAVRYGPSDGTISISLDPQMNLGANRSAPQLWHGLQARGSRPGWPCHTVCIHDEGGNIPPEVLPHLFDRFYRADDSRSSSTGGVGLGLAIAREIARRHNGDISITSEPGSGTLVCIRLPRR
jgi:signal transduction histidine kinase